MDLAKLRDGYVVALSVGADTWADQPASAPRRKTIAEDIFLRFVIGWDTFLSEWFIGCVSHDTTQYRVTVEKRMQSWLAAEVARSDYGPNGRHRGVFPPPTLSLAKNPPVDDVRELLDPDAGTLSSLLSRTYPGGRTRSWLLPMRVASTRSPLPERMRSWTPRSVSVTRLRIAAGAR